MISPVYCGVGVGAVAGTCGGLGGTIVICVCWRVFAGPAELAAAVNGAEAGADGVSFTALMVTGIVVFGASSVGSGEGAVVCGRIDASLSAGETDRAGFSFSSGTTAGPAV